MLLLWLLAVLAILIAAPALFLLAVFGAIVIAIPLAAFFAVWILGGLLLLLLWPGAALIDALLAFALGMLVARCLMARPPRYVRHAR